jgi:lysophospholipase L1-like esterase
MARDRSMTFDFANIVVRGKKLAILVTTVFGLANGAHAQDMKWAQVWTASPQPTWEGDFPLPTLLPFNLWEQTVRQNLRVGLGSETFRIVLSNEYGTGPLRIDAVHLALPGSEPGSVDVATDKTVTFSGQDGITVPAGAPAMSDPVTLPVGAQGDLVVTFFVSGPAPIETFHWDGQQTGWIAPGNQVSASELDQPIETTTRIYLTAVLAEVPAETKTVVAIGDSITDGAASGMDANSRWPDFLSQNLSAQNVAVVNAGISGARLLDSRMGENAAARFTRDVLSVPGVSTVVVLIGINDISWPGQSFDPDGRLLTLQEIIVGYRQLIALAHSHNIRIVAGTLTPFKDALKGSPLEGYYSPERDALRQEVNGWIRTSGEFDAVIDLDRLLADPADPLKIAEGLQADYLHLSAAGNKMVADAMTQEILFGSE